MSTERQYAIQVVLRYHGRLPETCAAEGDHVRVTLGPKKADVTRWKEPPHLWMANLAVVDTKAVKAFLKKYGVLWENTGPMAGLRAAIGLQPRTFDEHCAPFVAFQQMLRKAWRDDSAALTEVENQIGAGLEISVLARLVGVGLVTKNLASFICVLFLRDYAEGHTKVCANPDCPAPYFLAKRKTQKYCERGDCTAYAQRQYALGWWKRDGKQRRAKLQRKKRRAKP
jgi:hypothetical protein